MKTILGAFADLMELPYGVLALAEARSKFQHTYMIVNGRLVKIEEISENFMTVLTKEESVIIDNTRLVTLAKWMPKSGVYLDCSNRVVYLIKCPKKQYRQSFSFEFYKANRTISCFDLFTAAKMSNIYQHQGEVFYLDVKIGEISPLPKCTNSLFKKEFYDFTRNHTP